MLTSPRPCLNILALVLIISTVGLRVLCSRHAYAVLLNYEHTRTCSQVFIVCEFLRPGPSFRAWIMALISTFLTQCLPGIRRLPFGVFLAQYDVVAILFSRTGASV